jgi:endoglucanase
MAIHEPDSIFMRKNILIAAFCAVLFPFCLKAQTGFIGVSGKDIVTADGRPFIMRGTNLGNWLMPEGYMFKFSKTNSPKLINEAIAELIGPDEAKLFWQKYQDSYITQPDIHYLKSIGVNSIRIPFNYKIFTS